MARRAVRPWRREAPNPRADFKRVRQSLAARHLIGERDGLVWKAVE
jgi:hypothetical protein